MTMKPSILVVEDEEAIVTLLKYTLERKGFDVFTTTDGDEALLLVEEKEPDLVLLDWMLPGLSGIDICRSLRSSSKNKAIPIIIVSAKGEEDDRITGLEVGADDYIVKPFSPYELVARVNAVLRRIRPAAVEEKFTFADIEMDVDNRKVMRKNREIHLGPKEFYILQALLEYPKRVLSRDQLIQRVWGEDLNVSSRTVDVHINRLRNALNDNGKEADVIRTIRAAGYSLKDPEEIDNPDDA